MADKPEALRLAEQLEDPVNAKLYLAPYVAAELRRLHAVNAELLHFAKAVVRYAGNSGDDYLADKARAAIAKAEGQT